MKKIFLLIVLLFQLTIVFGQNSDWSEYGSWFSGSCFPQIQTRISVNSNPKINTTSVMVQFKNNYSQQVTFNYNVFNNSAEAIQVFKEKGTLLGGSQSSIGLKPGETRTIVESIKGAGSNRAHIEIYSLYFGNDYQHYQKCIDGSACLFCQVANEPACPNYSKNENNSSTSKNSNQQNSNSDYESSKADLERQMAEKNAEITRQNQENTNKLNIWNNAIKAGVDAHNSGNYTEAKNQFTIAINNSTNESNRQNAQNYYNKSVEAEKSQAKIKAINQVTTTLADFAKSIDITIAQRKADRKAKIDAELAKKRNYYDLTDNELFGAFVSDVIFEFKKIGQNPISIGSEFGIDILKTFEDKLPEFRSTTIKYRDFDISIMWQYNEERGEKKNILLRCKNENLSKELTKTIQNKWSIKKNNSQYNQYTYSNDGYNWSSYINDIEFTRSNTPNLEELNQKSFELAKSTYILANISFQEQEYDEAEQLLLQSANLGSEDAKLKLIELYAFTDNYNGKNYHKAKIWAENSANLYNPKGLYFLGLFYFNGWGIEKNIEKANEYYKMSCDLQYLEACNKFKK